MLKKLFVLTAILALALVATPAMAADHATDDVTVTLTIDPFCFVNADALGNISITFDTSGVGSGSGAITFTWGSNVVGTITANVSTASPTGTLELDDLVLTGAGSDLTGPSTSLTAATIVSNSSAGTVDALITDVPLTAGTGNVSGGVVTITCVAV